MPIAVMLGVEQTRIGLAYMARVKMTATEVLQNQRLKTTMRRERSLSCLTLRLAPRFLSEIFLSTQLKTNFAPCGSSFPNRQPANVLYLSSFRSFGPLRYARITKDPSTGRSRGTGFACFWNKEDADRTARQSELLHAETLVQTTVASFDSMLKPTSFLICNIAEEQSIHITLNT